MHTKKSQILQKSPFFIFVDTNFFFFLTDQNTCTLGILAFFSFCFLSLSLHRLHITTGFLPYFIHEQEDDGKVSLTRGHGYFLGSPMRSLSRDEDGAAQSIAGDSGRGVGRWSLVKDDLEADLRVGSCAWLTTIRSQ